MNKFLTNRGILRLGRVAIYAILIFAAIACITPFIWMVLTSFKTNAEALRFPPTIFPQKLIFSNYTKGWKQADFTLFTRNTIVLALSCTIGVVFSVAFVGYGFGRFKARGSVIWYMIMLSTMMLPSQVTLVPQYLLFSKLRFIDTYWPMIIPSWLGGGAFNIFLYTQFFKSLPKELNEAAIIDGANTFQTFWHIMLPSIKAVALCVGVMALVYNWNDFFTPLIYLNTTQKYTISIGLQFLNSTQGNTAKIGIMMAVSVITMLPVLVIFFIAQKYFIQGIKITGMKG
jgi:multiple sugar transport system permease protein